MSVPRRTVVIVVVVLMATLRDCCEAYLRRFGVREADLYHVLRALTYFADAEKDPVLPAGLDASGWAAIKAFFLAEAPKLLG